MAILKKFVLKVEWTRHVCMIRRRTTQNRWARTHYFLPHSILLRFSLFPMSPLNFQVYLSINHIILHSFMRHYALNIILIIFHWFCSLANSITYLFIGENSFLLVFFKSMKFCLVVFLKWRILVISRIILKIHRTWNHRKPWKLFDKHQFWVYDSSHGFTPLSFKTRADSNEW